jgi:translation initiation factor 6
MGIYMLDVYRSPNIGIFLKANNRFVLVPRGLAPTKCSKLSLLLGVKPIRISVAGSRLLGPLVALNDNGILVSRLADEEEIKTLSRETGLRVSTLPSKYTSVGNLLAANNKGAIASPLLHSECLRVVNDTLDVPVEMLTIAGYTQVGSLVTVTDKGAAVHPKAAPMELERLSEVLSVDVEPATINGGVPYVTSGILVNQTNAVVGSLTTGPELMILSRVFKV